MGIEESYVNERNVFVCVLIINEGLLGVEVRLTDQTALLEIVDLANRCQRGMTKRGYMYSEG